jgi:UDP-N-acetylglucosamine--N-acetylmuramyl-(pentapeptide) pyrophosphoryl-undecaprenol N-acetylglucosamine transferase
MGPQLVSFLPAFLNSLRRHVQFYRQFKPDVVAGLGGYGCLPAGLAAALQGIPLALMDQNVLPGRAVRCLHPFSDLFIAQWQASRDHLRTDNVRVLGNPIRTSLKQTPSSADARERLGLDQDHRVLLVMGGSQGAKRLNEWVLDHLDLLNRHSDDIAVIHIAGTDDQERVSRSYESSALQHHVIGFTEEMDQIYPAADLVLSRAGGTSLAELAYLKQPAVLVPYPRAMENHQLLNAREAASDGGCILLRQDEFCKRAFREQIIGVLRDRERCRRMSGHLDDIRKPNAASRISSALLSLTSSH